MDDVEESRLITAIDLLEGGQTIFLAGQLRASPVVLFLRYVLTMLKRRVVLLDANGGLATEMARTLTPKDVLLAVSFRFYAKEVVAICEGAHGREIPVIAVTDSTLSPLAKTASVLFAIPEDDYSFSRSLAAPMCLAQALMIGLAERLETDSGTPPRIPLVTDPDHRR